MWGYNGQIYALFIFCLADQNDTSSKVEEGGYHYRYLIIHGRLYTKEHHLRAKHGIQSLSKKLIEKYSYRLCYLYSYKGDNRAI